MNDDFKDHPVSINEVRAKRTQDATIIKPREVLIDLLRQIDNGLVIETLICCYEYPEDEIGNSISFRQSSKNILLTVGLMEAIKGHLVKPK